MINYLKSASRHFAACTLLLAGLVGVSAAPGVHNRPAPGKRPAPPRASKALPRSLQVPPLNSVSALKKHIALVKKWGKEHNVRVKTGYLEAYLYRLRHLAYPNDQVDWNRYVGALGQRSRMAPARLGRRPAPGVSASATASWEFVGPNSLGVPYQIYYGQGTLSGRVADVAYDPGVTSTYWVATAGGGVWKSVDSGQNWIFLSGSWPALETSCVTVNPSNPNIVYVGTGDYQGVGGFYGFGIMKSTDGGANWTNVGNGQFGNMSVSDIVVDPENPLIVTATTGRGRGGMGRIWRSVDGGTNWSAVNNNLRNWANLSIGTLNGSTRYYWAVGNGSASADVWRSSDRGATWTKMSLALSTGYYEGIGIAASKINPDTAYLINGPDLTIFKTINAGTNWTDITAGFPSDDAPGDAYNWSQSWYDWHINTSTNGTQDVVYVGLVDLAVSPNGGATWRSAGSTYASNALTHNDQHCLTVNPTNPNEVLVGNDGGIFRLTYNPTANTVVFNTTLNAGLGITQFYKADYHPSDPTRMLGGTQDNATPVALGNLSQWDNVCGGDGCGCAVNPNNPNIQYASSQYQSICRTTDQWSVIQQDITPNWSTDRVPFIGRLVLDPSNPNVMYAGSNYLWKWNEVGQSWTPRLGARDLAPGNGDITAIAVAPSNSSVIYTGASSGEVFVTINGGTTWTQINTGTSSLPNRSILAISINPANPASVLVGVSGTGTGHLWSCPDTSAVSRVWSNVSGSGGTGLPDVPVNAIVRDPAAPTATFYVGTDVGVFTTANSGSAWTNATAPLGLPNVIVNDLKLVTGTGYLMAATYGRGIWRLNVGDPVLTLTSPNGGELWSPNTSHNVTWSSSNITGNVKLEYSTNAGAMWNLIAGSTPNDGSEAWVVPNSLTTQALVRVSSVDDPSVSDTSAATFTIALIGITVTAPNGGETWPGGSSQSITWNSSNLAGNVKLEYSLDNGGGWTTILASTANDGNQSWTVPSTPTTQGLVRVTSLVDGSISDTSDAPFTIPAPTITVTSPNGGEFWTPSSSQTITWNSANVNGNVKLEYATDGGTVWTTIIASTPNDGSQSWTVPNVSTSQAKVRVSSVSTPAILDISDGNFTIGTVGITLTAPNGGELWEPGSVRNITWTSSNITGNVKLEYTIDNGSSWITISANLLNDGSETWIVPNTVTTQARVRITSLTNGSISDMSDAVFAIGAPTITVTAPNGGETWVGGTSQNITWTTANFSGALKLEYSVNNGASWIVIAASTGNDGIEPWTVPNVGSTQALVRISSVTASTLMDTSDSAFTLSPVAITVTSPNGGEGWVAGEVRTLTWNSSNVPGNVLVELSTNNGATWSTLFASIPNDGSEDWTVPSTATTQGRIRVTSVTTSAITDLSDSAFTIVVPTVTLTSPDGGETWIGNSVHAITWNSTSLAGNVKLEYSTDNGASWTTITASTTNDGTESWTVPNVASTQARVRVTSITYPGVSDGSNTAFTLSPVTLTLTAPNGGEVWDMGSAHNITWSSTNAPSQVKLEYSGDGGTNWTVLVAATANDGSEPWTVPTTPTTHALVRITSVGGALTDTSNAEFTVRYRGGILKAPAKISFGTVKRPKAKTVKLTLTNTSKTENLVISVAVTGTGFSLPAGPATYTILPKKNVKVSVTFTPTAAGKASGQFVITSSDRATPLSIPMSGTGK